MPVDEISFKELIFKIKGWLMYLKSKWIIICITGIFGASIGFTYAYFQKPTYTATLSFALEDDKSGSAGLSGGMGLASSLGLDLGTNAGGAFSGTNLIVLMKSRTLVEKALLNSVTVLGKTQSLADYYLEFSKLRDVINQKSNLSNIHYKLNENRKNFSLEKDSLLGEIYKVIVGGGGNSGGLLNVSQKDKKVSIIDVDVKTENEIFSKRLTESIVEVVSEFYITTKSKKARINVEILKKQVDSVRAELNAAISGVAQASDNTFNLNSALNIKRTPTAKRQVDVQANTSILTQLVTNLEMAQVTLLKETPLIQIIDSPILPLKKEKVSKLKNLVLFGFLTSVFLSVAFIIKYELKINKKFNN